MQLETRRDLLDICNPTVIYKHDSSSPKNERFVCVCAGVSARCACYHLHFGFLAFNSLFFVPFRRVAFARRLHFSVSSLLDRLSLFLVEALK